MSKAKLKLDDKALEQILRSPEMQRELGRRANNIAKEAGPGFRSFVYQGDKDRARARVWSGTQQAKKAEAEDRALTRAIDAGRK